MAFVEFEFPSRLEADLAVTREHPRRARSTLIFSDYDGSIQDQFHGERRRFLIADIVVRFPVALQILTAADSRQAYRGHVAGSSSSRRASRPARQQETLAAVNTTATTVRAASVQSVEILLSPLNASLGRSRDVDGVATP